MLLLRIVMVGICLSLFACGEDPVVPPVRVDGGQKAEEEMPSQPANNVATKPIAKTEGGVSVKILPDHPTSTDCLRAVIQGISGRGAVTWSVNGNVVASGTSTQLCNDQYRRDDIVTVMVGTSDIGAEASVQIENSPPRVIGVSLSPVQIFAGVDISVLPDAQDADGDEVLFNYEWLINGEANPLMTEATLSGDTFTKGDNIQVRIVPNDFYTDGPVYEGSMKTIGNAAPHIVSEPPSEFKTLDYRYQVEVSDPDDTQFTFRLDEGPEGMEIDPASGLVRWSLEGVEPGVYQVSIIVTDPEGAGGAQAYVLTLGAPQ